MSSRPKKKLYAILDVNEDASPSEIRSQYKKLVLKYHPDKNENKEEATAKFREIQTAYNVLSDEQKRNYYDRFGDMEEDGGPEETVKILPIFASIIIEAAMSLLTPLDVISKRMKFPSGTSKIPTFMEIVRSIQKREGFYGLWKGTSIQIGGSILSNAVENFLSSYSREVPLLPLCLSALTTYPLDVLTTCLRLGLVEGFFHGFFEIISQNGIKGLFSGLRPLVVQNVVYLVGYHFLETSSLNAWVSTKVKEKLDQGKFGFAVSLKLLFSVFKVAALTFLTTPLKTIVVRSQGRAALDSIATTPTTPAPSLLHSYTTEGFASLYRGYFLDTLYLAGNRFIQSFLENF